MLFCSRCRAHFQRMMEDMKENQNMLFITTRLSSADVTSNHVSTTAALHHDRGELAHSWKT
jgi:hypothetical protein